MIQQLNIYGKTKVEVAVDRLRAFEPPEGYYLAFSGGKDSVVIKALADMAQVKYDAHYNLTSVDAPELVQFIKTFDDVEIDIPKDKDNNPVTMWNLIPKKLMPPTRIVRYCCQSLKEESSNGRMTITGVRWAESANRKNNQGVITVMRGKSKDKQNMVDSGNFMLTTKGVVLNNDNEASRKMVETCYQRNKTVVNPIIDWSDEDVWEFIHEYNVPYCKLYDEGFKRLGCIGCPMSSHQAEEFRRYPKMARSYIRAFDRMLNVRKEKGLNCEWKTGEEVMVWWLGEKTLTIEEIKGWIGKKEGSEE